MELELHFSAQDWARIEQNYEAWWEHELERPLVQIHERIEDPSRDYPETHGFITNHGDISAEEIVAIYTANFEAIRYYGDAFPHWWPNYGAGVMAAFVGAIVHPDERTVWFEPPRPMTAPEIVIDTDPDNYWWQKIKGVMKLAVDTWGQQVQVCHTDIGGNMDVIASLRGTQNLLMDVYDVPDVVERLVNEVTVAWIDYYRELDEVIRPGCRGTCPWAPIWSKNKTYMLQCDFSYMISPAMFERFVLPDLVACCDYLDRGFYHLDGKGEIPHLDMLLAMPRLRGVQWIPGDGAPPPEDWLDLLKRIIDGGKLCQLFVTAEGALKIVRNLGGKGFMFSISDEMTETEAEGFLSVLRQADAAR